MVVLSVVYRAVEKNIKTRFTNTYFCLNRKFMSFQLEVTVASRRWRLYQHVLLVGVKHARARGRGWCH